MKNKVYLKRQMWERSTLERKLEAYQELFGQHPLMLVTGQFEDAISGKLVLKSPFSTWAVLDQASTYALKLNIREEWKVAVPREGYELLLFTKD